MKFDFFFYEIHDAGGHFVKSYFEEEFSEELVPEGGTYEMKYYQGCPAHSSWPLSQGLYHKGDDSSI